MDKKPNPYAGYRYPAAIIRHAVWLYLRFTLSLRDVEELLAARRIVVTYESAVSTLATSRPGRRRAGYSRSEPMSQTCCQLKKPILRAQSAMAFGEIRVPGRLPNPCR